MTVDCGEVIPELVAGEARSLKTLEVYFPMTIEIATKLKAELYFITILCIAAISVEILAVYSVLKPSSESVALWFQRSGAITSIFCAFAQFRINNFLESIRGGAFAESWWLYNIFNKQQYSISWAVTFLAIWGAFVWGYGDLFAKYFVK
ncbi:hypothetical protein ACXX82_14475 [Glaciimonas sp. GNP009]